MGHIIIGVLVYSKPLLYEVRYKCGKRSVLYPALRYANDLLSQMNCLAGAKFKLPVILYRAMYWSDHILQHIYYQILN